MDWRPLMDTVEVLQKSNDILQSTKLIDVKAMYLLNVQVIQALLCLNEITQ